MKYLLTRCPNCRASFYVKLGDEEQKEVECPYCSREYVDNVQEARIRDAEYHWELYRNLYPPLKDRYANKRFLKMSGLMMLATIPFFIFAVGSLFFVDSFSILGSGELATHFGFGLAGTIFLGFTIAGTVSSFQRYSFPIAASGAFFGIINSALWAFFGSYSDTAHNLLTVYSNLFAIPLIISVVALSTIIHYRWNFYRS